MFRKILGPFDYIRRGILFLFNRAYFENKLAKRKGKCKKCGKCCEGCMYLDKKTKLCKIYNKRPCFVCHKDFPLDKVDLWLWNIKDCGYRFEK